MSKYNKYQEALNRIEMDIMNCGNCDGDFNKKICLTKCEKKKDIILLQELVDKKTAMEQQDRHRCPKCNAYIEVNENLVKVDYCWHCGQKLNWEMDKK